MPTSRAIVCEINALNAEPLEALEQIAHACARDVGQSIAVELIQSSDAGPEPVITLQLPAELAASQHPVWCLACRLACFCPQARVSVLVTGAITSSKTPKRNRQRDVA